MKKREPRSGAIKNKQGGESVSARNEKGGVIVEMFADPRQKHERRLRQLPDLIPDVGCRRRLRRRNRVYLNDENWWTKRSYFDRG